VSASGSWRFKWGVYGDWERKIAGTPHNSPQSVSDRPPITAARTGAFSSDMATLFPPPVTNSLNSRHVRAIIRRGFARPLPRGVTQPKGTHGIGGRLQRSPFGPQKAWQ
jgi:hypothetical protein